MPIGVRLEREVSKRQAARNGKPYKDNQAELKLWECGGSWGLGYRVLGNQKGIELAVCMLPDAHGLMGNEGMDPASSP